MGNRVRTICVFCLLFTFIVLGNTTTALSAAKESYETVKFGFVGALTGPMSMFGIAGQRGLQLWADDVKARGGISVGGKKYLVEVVARDDRGMPGETLKAARDLVLKEKVKALFVFLFSDVPAAFCSEQKVLEFGVIAAYMNPKTPYLLTTGNQDPEFMAPVEMYVMQKLHPEIKTVAITSIDDNDGRVSRAWSQIAADLAGVKVVYNKPFAKETLDFAPIVSAMLANKPDFLAFGKTYPQFNAAMTEQAYLQGYKGPIYVNFCEIPVLASKVPKEWLEGRIVVASHDWEDPGMGKKANAIYAEAARRWDYVPSAIALPYEIGTVWEQGVKRAGTFDSTAVKNVLVDPKNEFQGVVEPFSTRYYGKWGKEVYGIENYLLPKKGPVLTIKNLKLTTVGWFDYEEFFTKNGDFVVKRLDQEGMLWNQRKK